MQGTVRFKRDKNRGASDIFKTMIRPKIPQALDNIALKVTVYNRKNHTYQNRTMALENSLTWAATKRRGDKYVSAVIAGGQDIPTGQRYIKTTVFYRDDQGRLRVFPLIPPETIPKGTKVNVDYAVFVEVKGLPVLKQGIEYYRRRIAKILSGNLKVKKMPKNYTFKYTGTTADIYGGNI